MIVPFALGSYKRDAGFLPELRLRNLIVEQTPAASEKIVLLPRPGLKAAYNLGAPVQAIYCEPGVLGGSVVSLAGNGVYLNDKLTGIIGAQADRAARFAGTAYELVFCNGGSLYHVDKTGLSTIAFPDGARVRAVAVFDTFFLAVRDGTQRLYWSASNDGTSWPALNYSAATSRPDNLLDVVVSNDQIALLGESGIEFWQANPSGAADLPFTRIDGLTYSKGVLNTGAAVYADNTLIWVGSDGIVYRRSATPQRISDNGVEEQIAKSGTAYLFTFIWRGHTFLVLSLNGMTLAYDFQTQEWLEFSTIGFDGWRAVCGQANGIEPVFGDEAGNVLTLDEGAIADAGAAIERRFTAMLPGPVQIDNLFLDAQGGVGGDTSPIVVELSLSRDGSQTWSPFVQTDLGKRGEYRKRAMWRRLGLYDMGAVLDFRTTDAAPFTVQSLHMNEPMGGRGV
jgi:hypothetical protein